MPRPIVLVHGAWHGAWCWDRVAEPLRAKGFDVDAIELPFTGLEDDVAATRSRIERRPGAVVCGHSYGGIVITQAASGLEASHLVYLCAFNPDAGETTADLMRMAPPAPAMSGVRRHPDGTTTMDPEAAREGFYADCEPADAEAAIARLRAIPFAAEAACTAPAWRTTPSTYVICSQDRAILPSLQRELARRATRSVEWDTSHSPFLSQPDLVVDLLADLARS